MIGFIKKKNRVCGEMEWRWGDGWADVMQHARHPKDFPIRLIRGMSAMLLEARASISRSLTDIRAVILPDSRRTSRGQAGGGLEWTASVSVRCDFVINQSCTINHITIAIVNLAFTFNSTGWVIDLVHLARLCCSFKSSAPCCRGSCLTNDRPMSFPERMREMCFIGGDQCFDYFVSVHNV